MKKIQLGVSKKDITPKIGCRLYGYRPNFYSEGLHDELEAVAFVFEKDGLKCALISATVVAINESICDIIKKEIFEKTGILPENIMICATHTHTGPATTGTDDSGWGGVDREYVDSILIPRIAEAAAEANNKLVPVTMGYAEGESFVGINRREFEGATVKLGQRPWGSFNPKMTVISFKGEDGAPVANLIHYGCHPTAGGHILEISRDWPGVMTDRLEEISGGITAFINGPEGDVGPRLTNGETVGHNIKYIEELGAVAAADAVRIYKTIRSYNDADLSTVSDKIKLPVKPRMALDEAKAKLKEFEEKFANYNIGKLMTDFCKKTIKSYEDGYKDIQFEENASTAIRIGDIVLAGFEFEMFSEIGLRIQTSFKDRLILPVINVNGSRAYFPTEGDLPYGGYEVNHYKYNKIQPFTDNGDYELIKEALRILENI